MGVLTKIDNWLSRNKSGANLSTKAFINQDNIDMQPGLNLYNTQMPDLAAVWGQYTDSNLAVLYHELPEIYIPVHIVASRLAGGVYQVKKKGTDEVVDDNKYMNKLLSTPNPLQNWSELVYQLCAYEMVCGKSFLYGNVSDVFNLNYRTVATLVNLQADIVYIQTDPFIKYLSATTIQELIKAFIVPEGMNGLVSITPDKVMYTKYQSLYAYDMNIRGRSPLLSAQKAVSNLCAVYEARNVIYTKRGALGFLVSRKSDASGMQALTKSEKEEAMKEYNKSYGLTGHGKDRMKSPVGMLTVPVDYIKVGASIQDMQPFEETAADTAAIFAIYGIPRDLMPGAKGSTFENQNHADKTVYDNVVIPRAKSLCNSLTSWLGLDEVGLYLDVSFAHVHVLQENLKEKASVDWRNNETSRVRFTNGIITLNDWRKTCGLDAVVNGFYDKLLYEMSQEELAQVEKILSIAQAKSPGGGTNPGEGSNESPSDSPTN